MITFADILARDIAIEWFEAVAAIAAICERVQSGGETAPVPELWQVTLSSAGAVTITGGLIVETPVARLGLLLQELLVRSNPPVRLRLLVGQATATVPTYTAVSAFAAAVRYWERPNRPGVLQALYARALAAPAPSPTGDQTVDERVRPQPPVAPAKPVQWAKWRRAIVPAAAAIVAMLAASYAWTHVGRSPQVLRSKALMTGALHAFDAAALSGASKVSESLGFGKLGPAESAPRDEPPAVPQRMAKKPESRSRDTHSRTRLPIAASTPAVAPAPPTALVHEPPHSTAQARGVAEEPVRAASRAVAPAEVESPNGMRARIVDEVVVVPTEATVYSSGSPGVTPPIGQRSQLARELFSSVDRGKLARISFVVGTDGSVDSVQLLDPPADVRDLMFMSVAKAWQFQPAMKDGMPVRFRKTVWVLASAGTMIDSQ